ncbi:MAG: tryptophan synthase subunit alpha [Flavobacteriales bacterium]|nr:tryptophan synthase subunit alpha [Flavobacteriales bacterium]
MNTFKKSHKQLSIFVTAGYPNLESLPEQLSLLEAKGVDFVEVGIPFSDPMADGPTIQKTSDIALKNGMNLDRLFDQLREYNSNLPVVLMGYLNPVLAYGIDRFLSLCKEVGVSSVILPDMSLEIYERFYQTTFHEYEITPCFLITPSTSTERIATIAKTCRNSFVYLVSSNATTGENISFGQDQKKRFERIRSACGETPLFMGFGIDSKEKVDFVHEVCDGAIIGSAYLKALEHGNEITFLESLQTHEQA